MPKIFRIKYTKSFEKVYEVLASSEKNAIEALDHEIQHGYIEEPTKCVDAEFASEGAYNATDRSIYDVDGRVQ